MSFQNAGCGKISKFNPPITGLLEDFMQERKDATLEKYKFEKSMKPAAPVVLSFFIKARIRHFQKSLSGSSFFKG
jgi:hypothetical protein